MMSKKSMKPIAAAMGAAFAGTLLVAGSAGAAQNPFGMTELHGGYMQLAEAKCGAAKSAEAKCGAQKKAESKCGANKTMSDGKCGGAKAKAMPDGKCGTAKCGGAKAKSMHDGKCGSAK
jgi:uncharacterized low-complexity protein